MNERSIVTASILGSCVFVVILVAFVLMIIILRRRCNNKNKNETIEIDEFSITSITTAEEGISNLGMDDDGLVSATKQRTPVTPTAARNMPENQGLDPRIEQMLDDAYADARQFAKFPNMP